ncbi:MAG TPA: DUF1802 family protein [Tepidisphaeraceae bacterium]|nr:DUF1802 family protein [Tepidisphaeraceae bacterium]
MAWPTSLQIALKEWASVCAALESGRQIILLRKGGIYEAGGEFELENREFLLFPTYLHQNPTMLKPEVHPAFEARTAEPEQVRISVAGVVTDIIKIASRAQMDALEDEHVWATPLIDMRFGYKPQNPLYLMLVRAYRLHEPLSIVNTPAYAGCKSWAPLEQEVATGDALPVLDDVLYAFRRKTILEKMNRA